MDFALTCQAVKDICLRKMDSLAPEQHANLLYYYASFQDVIPASLDRDEVTRIVLKNHKSALLPEVFNDTAYFKMWLHCQPDSSWEQLVDMLAGSLDNYPAGFTQLIAKPNRRTTELYLDKTAWQELFDMHPEMVFLMMIPFAPPLVDAAVRDVLTSVKEARDYTIIER